LTIARTRKCQYLDTTRREYGVRKGDDGLTVVWGLIDSGFSTTAFLDFFLHRQNTIEAIMANRINAPAVAIPAIAPREMPEGAGPLACELAERGVGVGVGVDTGFVVGIASL
jgi:hypothetical protein